jgi:hypothetical protein
VLLGLRLSRAVARTYMQYPFSKHLVPLQQLFPVRQWQSHDPRQHSGGAAAAELDAGCAGEDGHGA